MGWDDLPRWELVLSPSHFPSPSSCSREARQTCPSYLEEGLGVDPKVMLPEKLSFTILCLGEGGDP